MAVWAKGIAWAKARRCDSGLFASGVSGLRWRGCLESLVPWELGGTFCSLIRPMLCQGHSFHHPAFLPAAAAQEAGLSLFKILFIVPF